VDSGASKTLISKRTCEDRGYTVVEGDKSFVVKMADGSRDVTRSVA
jgi:hypothetical protein